LNELQGLAEDPEARAGFLPIGKLYSQVRASARKFDTKANQLAFSEGGPMGVLGSAAKEFYGGMPRSGTPERAIGLGGIGLSAALAHLVNPLAAVPAVAGLAGNRMLQNYLRNPNVQRRLIQTSLNPNLIPSAAQGMPAYTGLGAGLLGQNQQ
jgi:hypothetical protein